MKYPIKKEFGFFRHFRPPISMFALRLAKPLLSSFRKKRKGVTVKKITLGSVPAYDIRPNGSAAPLPALLYIHGGGFVFKAAPMHYDAAAQYALSGRAVFFVDYALAFEKNGPVPDAEEAYSFAFENARKLCVDPSRIAIGGDSAGAYLCLEAALKARERGLPLPEKMMLVYPVADPKMRFPSMQKFTDTPMWNSRLNKRMWELFRGKAAPVDPFEESFAGFPPVYVETAEFDCLHDEGVALCQKLASDGVDCRLFETEGTMHGYDIAFSSKSAKAAVQERVRFLSVGRTVGQ